MTFGGILFGWAKPVPVNFGRLGHPRRDMILVAAAGPGINIGLAILSAIGLHFIQFLGPEVGEWIARNLINSINLNLLLAVFNMLPLRRWMAAASPSGCCPTGWRCLWQSWSATVCLF